MKGFILNTQLVKEEDLLVTILTKNRVLKLYRFYGARHSIVNIGFFIDFEIEENIRIDRLRHIYHIPFPFLMDINKMNIWQTFIKLLYKHLFDIEKVDSFYFELLNKIIFSFHRNPKRVLIENYTKLIEFEGRLSSFECFLCEKVIHNRVNLTRGFLCACENCIPKKGFEIIKIETLFKEKKTILLDDKEIETLYQILLLGI